jgi:glycosyltransferase involved in cell wall biosynthesis
MKKVLIIDSLIGNDYTICLASALQNAGAEITLIVPENRDIENPVFTVKKWLPSKDSRKSKLLKILTQILYLFRLAYFLIKERPAAVHFQFFRFNTDPILFYILSLFHIRLIYTAHNILPHNRFKNDYRLFNLVYKSADKIIVHSAYIKAKLLSMFNIDSSKIEVIPHGNFNHYLPETEMTKEAARSSLKLGMPDNVVLFFGAIREYKGVDLLLDAFEIICKSKNQIKLLIAGAPDSAEVEKLYYDRIKEISENGNILFFPEFIPSEKVSVYFTASDVVALPYKRIDHSGVVHLAYSFAKPIIATRVGDFEEAIEEGKSGYLVAPDNAKMLAETIIKAFADKESLIRMGKYAGELNYTKYSWAIIAGQTLNIY